MHRFFINKNIFDTFSIDDNKEIHHALNVLRLKENDTILAFDGKGNEVLGVIERIDKDTMLISPQKIIKENEIDTLDITLACSLPKRVRFDYVIEKATELGVAQIIPLVTKRTEVRLNKKRQALKLVHWRNIAVNAAKQCKRATVPGITEIKTFKETLNLLGNYTLALLPSLIGERKTLKEILKSVHPDKILIFIGPEGDFTEEEISLAVKKGAVGVTLGNTVLRVDTAAIFTISAIKAILA